jgi:predicted PurR-regulated permease PerM
MNYLFYIDRAWFVRRLEDAANNCELLPSGGGQDRPDHTICSTVIIMPETIPMSPWRVSAPVPAASFTALLFAVAIVACLYIGREVLVPMALAVLMSFVLAPLVDFLQRWYVPRSLSVIVVVLLAFVGVLSLGGLMISQVNQLASDLPRYQSTLREKIQNLRGSATGTGTLQRASEVLQNLSQEINRPISVPPAVAPSAIPSTPERPIPVEVRQPDPGALQTSADLIAPLIRPLATAAIVVIFVIFILIQRQDLRNRLVRLAGSRDLQRTTAAIDDAGQRLSRLFLTQLALNAGFGLVIGMGLWFIGVPSAALWGMLAMILRFVPYIGALMSAIFPLVLAAAVGTGWGMLLWTVALFLIVEPIVGHAIEPVAYGHSTGLSPVAIITSATFWTWLWGPIGLVLATPLTICLVVLGRHVDRLKFLDVMLGDQPALTPPELVYQRMLARDPVEAAEQAETFLKEKPLVSYYEEVLVEALKLAQADADRGLLDDDRKLHVRDAVAEIVDDLSAHKDKSEPMSDVRPDAKTDTPLASIRLTEESLGRAAGEIPTHWRTGKPVLCVPGIGPLDEAFTMIVAQSIERQEIGVRAEQWDAISMSRVFSLDTEGVELLCLCYLANVTSAQIRYTVRRLRRKAPNAFILVTLAGEAANGDMKTTLQSSANVEVVQQSLRETIAKVLAFATSSSKLDELAASPSPGLSIATNSRNQPSRRAT